MVSGPRSTCRTWARAIAETWPDLDGLWSEAAEVTIPEKYHWERSAAAR